MSPHPKGRRADPRDELVRGSGVTLHLCYYRGALILPGKVHRPFSRMERYRAGSWRPRRLGRSCMFIWLIPAMYRLESG